MAKSRSKEVLHGTFLKDFGANRPTVGEKFLYFVRQWLGKYLDQDKICRTDWR